jgi:RHS repeat-associated protein
VIQKTLGIGDIVYTYDQGSSTINPVGRLTTLTDNYSGITDSYAYDPMGQIKETSKIINSQTYTTKTGYDSLGRVETVTYPDNLVIKYTNDALDNLIEVKDPSGAPVYALYGNYNAKGQYGIVTNANGVITNYLYNPYNNRLTSIVTNSPTEGELMNLAYDLYDDAGNIKHITDSINYPGGISRTRSYVYDDLDRLIEADSPSYSGKLLFQYDKIGNMTYNCKYGWYYYDDPNHVHAVTTIKKTDGTLVNTYNYDPNGNMYAGAGRAITYNLDNMPISINTTTFVYDHAGQRVKKNTTVYIDKLYECTNNICKKYIFAGSQRITNISNSGTYYYHADHLGSSSVVTDQTGANVEEIAYYPYGETRTNTGTVNLKHKFTGQEEDSETGLYYYGARYYDPKLARWITPDPILFQYFPDNTDPRQQGRDWNPLRDLPGMGGVYNSKNMNLYSYAHMNPIKLLDINGKVVIIGGHVAAEPLGYITKPDSYHLYLILIPDNPQDFTNRAGWINDPHGYMYATIGGQKGGNSNWYNYLGNLQSAFNYESDSLVNATFSQILKTPKGMTDTQFINNLYNAAASYKNNVNYDVFPELNSGYNSNSYVSGVIGAAGGTPPVLQTYGLFQVPGYYSPIPFYMFNYNSTSGSSNSESQGFGSTDSSDDDPDGSW